VGHPFDSLRLDDLRRRRSEKWRRYSSDVLPLWVAEMDFPLAEPIRTALEEMVARGDTGYPTRMGLPEAFAGFARERFELEVDPGRVWPVLDIMRGVFLALQLFTEPGDGVVIDPPVYPPFFETIRFAGRRVVEAPLATDGSGGWGLDLEAVERAFAAGARAWLMCSPHNPVGRVWTRGELEAAAALAERFDVRMIVDEVHAPLTYEAATFVPFASIDGPSAREAVTLASASKAWNLAGLKCALAVSSSETVARAFRGLPDEVRIEPSILGIAANEVAYREGRPWLDDTRSYLRENRERLGELLAARLPAIRWRAPEATFLAWLDCSALGLGEDPAATFLERGRVALTSGPSFGSQGRGHARINFATSTAILEVGLDRMAAAVAG
jgi:cystathionine beta-lyase